MQWENEVKQGGQYRPTIILNYNKVAWEKLIKTPRKSMEIEMTLQRVPNKINNIITKKKRQQSDMHSNTRIRRRQARRRRTKQEDGQVSTTSYNRKRNTRGDVHLLTQYTGKTQTQNTNKLIRIIKGKLKTVRRYKLQNRGKKSSKHQNE